MITTSGANKSVWDILTAIKDRRLIPTPPFQRRLVWTNKDKKNFLDTVLKGYPFPEIYIAAGDIDLETGQGTELLVDGQQRMTTLNQYFQGAPELKLGRDIPPYSALSDAQKRQFLQYTVVVRNLGQISLEEIKEVFARINATSYSLNQMEIHNSIYEGEFITFAENISNHDFFDNEKFDRRIFSSNDFRRMKDVTFVLTFIISIMSTYFNRDDAIEEYLMEYNDEFPMKEKLRDQIERVFDFVNSCGFAAHSRVWKTSDLLTLLVEIHRALFKRGINLDPTYVKNILDAFYSRVNEYAKNKNVPEVLKTAQSDSEELKYISEYSKAASAATNDRGSRIKRGEIIQKLISGDWSWK